jgi:endonuclease/exonuclease/phosphatase family metal-dependent hydrolase
MRTCFTALLAAAVVIVCLEGMSFSRRVVSAQAPSRATSAAAEKADLPQSAPAPVRPLSSPSPAGQPPRPAASGPSQAPAPAGQPRTFVPIPPQRIEVWPPATPPRGVPHRPGSELPVKSPEERRPIPSRPSPPPAQIVPRFPEGLGNKPPWDSPSGKMIPGDSLRIATFNTHLISPVFNKELFDSSKADADADLVADVIRHHGLNLESFDVIALNEVWDEDAKKILKDKLAPVFPYHIDKLDENTDLLGLSVPIPKAEDSGLMLFSRMPFVNFKVGNPASVTSVAFRCFAASSGEDALAAKGVGLVVVRHPASRRLYIVAFTHLQNEDRNVRSAQMKEIRALIEQVRDLNPETQRGEVFLLGDLNIEGCSPGEQPWSRPPSEANDQEWKEHFWTTGSYFHYPLYDAWAWTTSAFDRGFTGPSGHSRLDYIVHEREKTHPAYAVQHIRHIMVGQTNSDHGAVVADLNLPSAYCFPRLARRPCIEPQFANEEWDWLQPGQLPQAALHGQLRYPGSMQWYRFDDSGTYSIALPKTAYDLGLRTTIYEKHDLSNPVEAYAKVYTTTIQGQYRPELFVVSKYHLPSAPFFVRVSNPTSRTWQGDYSLAVHRHRGTTRDDAILLYPGEVALDPKPPTNKPINAEDQIWFELRTDKAHSGEPQDLEFYVEDAAGEAFQLALRDSSGTKVLAESDWIPQAKIKRKEPNAATWYLTLQRKSYTQKGMTVGWRTNLTWLTGLGIPGSWPFKLVCGDETGSDWKWVHDS